MYELIAAAVIAISTAIAKGVQQMKARLAEEGLTSKAFSEEGKALRDAGWNEIEKGYVSGNILLDAGNKELLERWKEQKRVKKDEEFNRMLLFIVIGAAILVIVFLVIKRKQ